MKQILRFKSFIGRQIERLWTEPESSFMAGLLFGARSGFPDDVKENFSKTGVTHIVAVSGFNITIIATTLMTILVMLGLWRQQAFWGVVITLFVFVIFTGASASVVRAGIMGTLTLVATHVGRTSRIANVLVCAAAIMVLDNPYVLLWDAGFQLSFLSTLGLVYISPLLDDVLGGGETFATPVIESLRQTLFQTLSAIIATLPLILFQFGRLLIVAPLVNVLILWTIPWLMLGGFIAVVLSFVFFPLGQLIAWVCTVGLKYVLIVVKFFGELSWSAVELQVPWWGMALAYGVIAHIIIKKRKNNNYS